MAACKNASAALFTSAKITHLALLPQGQVERYARVVAAWSSSMDAEGFGSCSNEGECEAVCPKEISITNIARMNREYFRARCCADAKTPYRVNATLWLGDLPSGPTAEIVSW